MELTYFGHSTFQIETESTTLLFDPFFEDNPHTETTPDALAPDVVLVSHAHFDHYADVEAFAGPDGPLVLSNFEIISRVGEDYDHENVQPLNEGGTVDFEWGSVEAVHARHTSSFPDGSYGGVPEGFVLEFDERTVYYAGDTAPFAEMEWIGDLYDVDLMLAPVGDVVTMGVDGAIHAADMTDADAVVPIHYNTFPFIQVDIEEVAESIEDAGVTCHQLDPNSTLSL
ncbi:hydrolase [Salinibacter sp. 10B]|uniref:metal-dependent hydrolase n=1 Tax=Salinibacter sp. 10B TaxID=1923971 RepID=UPI000CF39503|nr:metal-dependent hydrolase [Salinibacter sp. 10B]PQJ33583.1 hydrolase [Salinibacter sp. 10B]